MVVNTAYRAVHDFTGILYIDSAQAWFCSGGHMVGSIRLAVKGSGAWSGGKGGREKG